MFSVETCQLVFVEVDTLDLAQSAHLAEALNQQCHYTTQTVRLILDLQNVQFITSSGIGFLISLYKSLNEHQGKVMIINVNPRVLDALKIANVHRLIELFAKVQK